MSNLQDGNAAAIFRGPRSKPENCAWQFDDFCRNVRDRPREASSAPLESLLELTNK